MCVYHFMILHVSVDNFYKLSTLVFTPSSYEIQIWIANCAMYYSHVHVIVFANVG